MTAAESQATDRLTALERENAALRRYGEVMAHDFANTVRLMSGYAEILGELSEEELASEGREVIAKLLAGAHRAQAMLGNLLVFARLEEAPFDVQDVDAKAVADRAVKWLGPVVEDTAAAVEIDELPAVTADPAQLEQALHQLVLNAIRFTADAQPRVRIAGRQNRGSVVISVSDEGPGVPPQDADRAFDPFVRLETRGRERGVGLGLAIVRRIAERHGGDAWIESGPGRGTTVCLSFPAG